MFQRSELRDSLTGELCSFRHIGAMLVADDIADAVASCAPTAKRIGSWDNAGFATLAYRQLRAAGFYTESSLDPHSAPLRRFRMLVLPPVTDANRTRLQAMRRAFFQL